MDARRFQRLKKIFRDALDCDPAQRKAFLQKACKGDDALRARIESLLETDGIAESFLETPALSDPSSGDRGDDLVGTRLGRYLIQGVISSGGMGVVYEALQEHPERIVAVKVMRRGIMSPQAIRRFEYEAQILANLRHPNITRVIEAGTVGSGDDSVAESGSTVPYFVMEFVPQARTITEFAREKGLTTRERLDLFGQVCDAVQHGHQKGIIHRDLKPSNILVDSSGHVKIIDFGVARATDSDMALTTALTEMGQLIGTLQYMSPEQCEADPGDLDARSDVYALGVVFYELLCDELPYDLDKAALADASRLIREEPPRKPSNCKRFLRGDLETILLTALEKDRRRRYQSASELGADIARYLGDEVILARRASPIVRFCKWIKRNPKTTTAASTASLAVCGLMGYLLFGSIPRIQAETLKAEEAKQEAIVARNGAEEQDRLASRHYDEITRLQDLMLLAELEARSAVLWPAYPENIQELNDWVVQAEEILGRKNFHHTVLSALREEALPYDDVAREQNRESHPRWEELRELKRSRDFVAERIEALTMREDWFVDRLALREEQVASLKEEIGVRRTWLFADRTSKWQHDTLTELVSKIDEFSGSEEGLLARIKERLAAASAIEEESIDRNRAAWEKAVASIADREICPAYDGLRIEPQVGLTPVGRDPRSGLWEFAHLQTGAIPERDGNGKIVLTNDTGLVFVLIPGGTFTMGAVKPSEELPLGSPNVDPDALPNEKPVRVMSVKPFLLSKYEMTTGQWLRFTGENPCFQREEFNTEWPSLTHPVEQVSWNDCVKVLFRLRLRLPTETEWEFAARAGTTTAWWTGKDKHSLESAANLRDLSANKHGVAAFGFEDWLEDGWAAHAPVGSFRPNPFGLHDIHGNVIELCRDSQGAYSLIYTDGSPYESFGLSGRICRGGSHATPAIKCRSARRTEVAPDYRTGSLGVRPAASLTEQVADFSRAQKWGRSPVFRERYRRPNHSRAAA